MNFVPKWAFLAVKLKKKVDLENEAHFEVFFQIYPSMLENFTGVLTILTLVPFKSIRTPHFFGQVDFIGFFCFPNRGGS